MGVRRSAVCGLLPRPPTQTGCCLHRPVNSAFVSCSKACCIARMASSSRSPDKAMAASMARRLARINCEFGPLPQAEFGQRNALRRCGQLFDLRTGRALAAQQDGCEWSSDARNLSVEPRQSDDGILGIHDQTGPGSAGRARRSGVALRRRTDLVRQAGGDATHRHRHWSTAALPSPLEAIPTSPLDLTIGYGLTDGKPGRAIA